MAFFFFSIFWALYGFIENCLKGYRKQDEREGEVTHSKGLSNVSDIILKHKIVIYLSLLSFQFVH